jgi:hypothetical protein
MNAVPLWDASRWTEYPDCRKAVMERARRRSGLLHLPGFFLAMLTAWMRPVAKVTPR